MNVLLLQPPPPIADPGDALPIGLASIASYLRKNNINADIIDLGKCDLNKDRIPDIVGIGASTPYAKNAVKLCERIRKIYPDAKIVLGGHHFTALPEEGLPHADAVVKGEGEIAMLDICLNGIKDEIVMGKPLAELDLVPVFTEDILDTIYKGRSARLHVIGSRGCPYSCVFCAEHSEKVRYNSADHFLESLRKISKRYHSDIFISDDLFTVNKERAIEICERIIKEDLNLKLRVFSHVNCFDREVLLVMKRAGVHTVSYGIESGNDDILKLLNKTFTTSQALEVIKKTEETGLKANCLYMVGNIGETKQTIKDTVLFSQKAGSQRWCSFAIPFPGTEFYKRAGEYGTILTKDWDKYTNRHIVYLPEGVSKSYMKKARNCIVPYADDSITARIRNRLGIKRNYRL